MTDSQNTDELIAIFTDKYVYNEGDVMRIKGVLRKRTGVGQVIVQIVSLTKGNTVFTGKYPLEKDQDFLTTWKIQGALLKPDTYQIYASIGNSQISTTFEYKEPGVENEKIISFEQPKPQQRGFLDSKYSPQYYVNRYNNDPLFREWCEKTYPDKNIFDIIGIDENEYAKILQDDVNKKLKEHANSEVEESISKLSETVPTPPPSIISSNNMEQSNTPESFLRKYKTDMDFQQKFNKNYPNITIEKAVGMTKSPDIPLWVKNIFKSYGDGRLTDIELVDTIRFLINEQIIKI